MKQLPTTTTGLTGNLTVPGDKSISHRALMFGAMANGTTKIAKILHSDDVTSTINALKAVGVKISEANGITEVVGKGVNNLNDPWGPINMGNSGTSTRLLTGLFTGANLAATIVGDASLSTRPMKRITRPLSEIGGTIISDDGHLPLQIKKSLLLPVIHQKLTVGSAQVKSAILLAGLAAGADTYVTDNFHSRNHTEQMLPKFGVEVDYKNDTIHIPAHQELQATEIEVPGDISSAAYWIVAGFDHSKQ